MGLVDGVSTGVMKGVPKGVDEQEEEEEEEEEVDAWEREVESEWASLLSSEIKNDSSDRIELRGEDGVGGCSRRRRLTPRGAA